MLQPLSRAGRALAALALAAGPPLARAQEADAPAPAFQVRAATLLVGDGTVLEDALLVVRGGRIRAVGADLALDPALPLIEHDGVLAPGFVACQTLSGARAEADDGVRSLLPEARLLDAVDPDHSDFAQALAAGITTVVVAPPPTNVAGGLTTVVKTDGARVLVPEAHLALSFSHVALGMGAQGDTPAPAGDGEVAIEVGGGSRRGTRVPTSYVGALRLLEERLASSDGAFARVARGELPVWIEAWDRHEVLRAAGFAATHGLRGTLRGARLAADPALVSSLAESGLGVVLGPFAIGHSARSLEAPRALAEAGVPIAFALDAPRFHPASFRLSAALALGAGAPEDAVLRGLTGTAAELAGVADRVGALRVGLDADFVLWSGDPLNLASRIQAVYVDGGLAWRAPSARDTNDDGGSAR